MSPRGPALLLGALLGCEASPKGLLGGERGLDHVGVAVRDLRAAQDSFQRRLGFERPIPGHLPNGLDNVNFYFEDATYLEALTPYDPAKADWLAWFLAHHGEGGNFVVLSARSASDTAAFLRQRGFATAAPTEGSIQIEGGRPGGRWRTLFFDRSPLPGSPLYFIEYPKGPRAKFLQQLEDPAIVRRSFYHRNTAVGLRAVWLAVADLDEAVRRYAAIGLPPGRPWESAALHARGQVLFAGRGALLLLSPSGPGPVQDFLARRGPGVLGFSIAVRELKTAQQVVAKGLALPPARPAASALYAGAFGNSFLVSDVHGAYVEFTEAATRLGLRDLPAPAPQSAAGAGR